GAAACATSSSSSSATSPSGSVCSATTSRGSVGSPHAVRRSSSRESRGGPSSGGAATSYRLCMPRRRASSSACPSPWAQSAIPASRLRPIHGDFHGDNVLVDGTRLALVDLEDCAMGDPADDVGSNWAQLTWHTIKAGRTTPIPEAGRRAFLDAYLGRTNAETAARVPVHAAMHCFLYAYQCLRHPQDADRYDDAEAMLGACEDVLAGQLP